MKEFEPEIETFTLVPSDGGRFEVSLNDRLIYSKLEKRRHPEPGEVAAHIRKALKEGI